MCRAPHLVQVDADVVPHKQLAAFADDALNAKFIAQGRSCFRDILDRLDLIFAGSRGGEVGPGVGDQFGAVVIDLAELDVLAVGGMEIGIDLVQDTDEFRADPAAGFAGAEREASLALTSMFWL